MTRLRWLVTHLLRRRAADRDLDDEIRAHLTIDAQQRMAAGASPSDAWQSARREFGNEVLVREITREAWGLAWIEHVAADIRFALRTLRRSPAFALIVCTTLALGIGISTAIFSVVDAVLLRPLPYPNPERMVSFGWQYPTGISRANISPSTYAYWQREATAFEALAVTSDTTFSLARDGSAERVAGIRATCDFFRVLQVFPPGGRGFVDGDCAIGSPPIAVISHRLATQVFARAAAAIGQSIALNDRTYMVVGVMPSGFRYEPDADIWTPLQLQIDPRDRGLNYAALGRLRAGLSFQQADAETRRLWQPFLAANPRHGPRSAETLRLMPLHEFLVADLRTPLLLMFGAVGLVLAIATANVGHLLLSRAAAGARQMAIRTALGARRGRLLVQTLVESLVLSSIGGLAGVLLANVGVQSLVAALPRQLPRFGDVTIDGRVIAFSAALTTVLGLTFAIIGALRVVNSDPAGVLKGTIGTGFDKSRHRFSSGLVVAEVTLSVVLLVGATLLLTTFVNLRGVPIGFNTDGLLTVQLYPSPQKFATSEAGTQLDAQLIERIDAIPGVDAVTTAASLPLERGPNFIFGREGAPAADASYVELRAVGPGYFSTLGIVLRSGRELTDRDAATAAPVVVVNETLAAALGGPMQAVGQRIVIGPGTPMGGAVREIVGVAANVADGRPGTRLFPTMYLPRTQFVSGSAVSLLIRVSRDASMVREVREAIQATDPQVLVGRIRSMREVGSDALAQQRFNMVITGVFAATALVLAMIGLYGLLSYQVAQRTREIGVRVALGANRLDVLGMVIGRGLLLTGIGLVLGSGGAIVLARFVRTLLFGVTETTPSIYVGVGLVLSAVALIAAAIPARRAMAADPVEALRAE